MGLPTNQEVFYILESHEAYDFLTEHCKFIGEGSFNKVYDHPHFNNRVIKYNGEQCDGTLDFAMYCEQNTANINLPIVFEHSEALWHEYVVQEKLLPLAKKYHDFINAIDHTIKTAKQQIDLNAFKTNLSKLIGKDYEEEELAFVQTVHKIMVQFASQYTIDISIDNVMLRDSTLVLVDPLAECILDY